MTLRTVLQAFAFALLLVLLTGADGCPVPLVQVVEESEPQGGVPIEHLAHMAVVQALINGQGPYDLVVDTGAGMTVLNSDLVRALQIPVVGSEEVGSPMGIEPIQADALRIGSITIGDAVVVDIPAIAMKLQDVFGPVEAPDGILAAASFEGYLMTIDFPGQSVLLRRGELPPADGRRVLACDPASVVPNIAVSFAGERVDVALDSGAPSTVVLPGRYDSILPLASKPIVTGHGRTVDAEFDILSSRLDGALDIGDIAIENPIIEFNDRAKQPHIGMRILGDYSLTIDRTNHRLMLERPGQGSTPQSPERRLVLGGGRSGYGIRLGGLGGETLEVLGVDAGLPAAEGGLAAGDLIVAMNGRPVASLSRDERVAALRGSPLLLHIERNSHEQELRLSLDRNGD